jgi:hypothetical protein
MQRKNDMYFRETTEDGKFALDVYFKVHEIAENEVSITQVSEIGILIYDTRISRKTVEDRFNYMKMVEIKEEDFNTQIIEKLKMKEKK